MKFFKLLSVISLTLIQTSAFADSETAHPARPKVAVVGAGLAGLTAAYRLHQKGFDVDVYEARNRVGGRLFSVKIDGYAAELGGQNVMDGGEPESTRALVEELGLQLFGGRFPIAGEYRHDGKSYTLPTLLKEKNYDPEELKIQLIELAEKSANMREVLENLLDESDPLFGILKVRMAAWEGGPIEKLSTTCIGTLYEQMRGGISVTHPGSKETFPLVDMFSIQGGNSLLPQKLAEALGEKVHLNSPLSAVSKRADGTFHLDFADGKQADTDLLVLAIPATVYSDISFEENLIPPERLDAIQKIEYGTVTRIVSPFHSDTGKIMAVFSNSMLLFHNPILPYFTIYCVGESSRFTQENVALPFQEAYQMLNLDPKALPVMARDELLASYHSPVAHSWPNDPYVKGSYSYIAAGQEEILTPIEELQGEKVRTLFLPIDGKLFFAGEHTTILMDGLGTIEAACESGERTARLIEKSVETPLSHKI